MANKSAQTRKVTLICPQFTPEKGAAASRMTKLAHALRARRFEVDVFTALPNYPTGRIFSEYRGRLWHSEYLDGILIKRYWLYPSNSTATLKRLLNMVSLSVTLFFSLPHLLRNRPNIILVNSPPLPVAVTAILIATIARIPLITNVSDIWPGSALELGAIKRGFIYSFLERIENFVYRNSDAIASQSSETRQHILDRCPNKKTFLYRNLDYRSDFIHQYPTKDGYALRLIYAGLLGVAQGVHEICTNVDFKELNAEFHIYGDGNERLAIHNYITAHPDCNIALHDAVPKSEMSIILTKFHATIIPLKTNIRGAFPSKIFMAIAASMPVLYCGSGESADFVRAANIGWISPPRDYPTLRKNIQLLSRMSNSEYISLRTRIRQLAIMEFDLDDQITRFVTFIDSVL